MATYKEIFGKKIKFLSSDPATGAEGQIWYNSTSDTFKSVLSSGAWTSASPLGTARYDMGGFGIQTAAVAAGGNIDPGHSTLTEEYNGSGWSTGGALATGRTALSACGTLTAGLAFGGGYWPPKPYNRCNRRIQWNCVDYFSRKYGGRKI